MKKSFLMNWIMIKILWNVYSWLGRENILINSCTFMPWIEEIFHFSDLLNTLLPKTLENNFVFICNMWSRFRVEISKVKQNHMCNYLHSKHWNVVLQWTWLFWVSFGRIQKYISYLTDNFPKQGYKVLFFPYPAATMLPIR